MMYPWEMPDWGINDKTVNAGTGRKLTPEESAFKTRNWPVKQKDFKPKDTFQELAYSFFNEQ